jgi:hypothetical protein
MVIDKKTIEGVTIFAYKLERYGLVQELLDLMNDLSNDEYFYLPNKPDLKLVVNNESGHPSTGATGSVE